MLPSLASSPWLAPPTSCMPAMRPRLTLRGGMPRGDDQRCVGRAVRTAVDRLAQWTGRRTVLAHLLFAAVLFVCNRLSIALMAGRHGTEATFLQEEIASSIVAVIHSIPACCLAFDTLVQNGWRPRGELAKPDVTGQNSPQGVLGLVFTNSYLLQDMVYMLRFGLNDMPVLIHHVLSFTFLTSVILSGRGDKAAALCILIGEITNPITNGYIISKALASHGHIERSTETLAPGLVRLLAALQWISLFLIRFCYSPWALCYRFLIAFFPQTCPASIKMSTVEASGGRLGGSKGLGGALPLSLAARILYVTLPAIIVLGSCDYLRAQIPVVFYGTGL